MNTPGTLCKPVGHRRGRFVEGIPKLWLRFPCAGNAKRDSSRSAGGAARVWAPELLAARDEEIRSDSRVSEVLRRWQGPRADVRSRAFPCQVASVSARTVAEVERDIRPVADVSEVVRKTLEDAPSDARPVGACGPWPYQAHTRNSRVILYDFLEHADWHASAFGRDGRLIQDRLQQRGSVANCAGPRTLRSGELVWPRPPTPGCLAANRWSGHGWRMETRGQRILVVRSSRFQSRR